MTPHPTNVIKIFAIIPGYQREYQSGDENRRKTTFLQEDASCFSHFTMSVNDVFETNIIKGVCHSSCHFTTLLLAMVVVELQHVKQVEQENA